MKTQVKRENSKFVNPWEQWPFNPISGTISMVKWLYSLSRNSPSINFDTLLPVLEPYFMREKSPTRSDILRVTWLGHASVLVEIDGLRVLCDPVFSDKVPPPLGPKRYRNPPCLVKDLPDIDVILISHNHYDHMDATTIQELSERFPAVQWLIPMDCKYYLLKMLNPAKIPSVITEMMWWETKEIRKSGSDNKLTIHFTPTQHWSNRGITGAFKSLWGSWAIIGEKHKFWFGGDTGYCDAFKEIGQNFGYFDAAAIPIGAYEPREMLKFQHCDPKEAVQIHKDINSKYSIGIHWGTFRLSSEHYMDPKKQLDQIAKDEEVQFRTINHGETLEVFNDTYKVLSSEGNCESLENKAMDISIEKEISSGYADKP